MPARSKISQRPKDLGAHFDAKIVTGGFADFRGLTAWLNKQGYEIRKSAVANYGHNLERKLAAVKRATEQAKVIVSENPDDEGALNDALIRLVQQIDFDILTQLDEFGIEDVDPKHLAAMTRSVASLARATVAQKKWMAEARAKLKAKVSSAEDKVAEVANSGGLSADAAQKIRDALLDINV